MSLMARIIPGDPILSVVYIPKQNTNKLHFYKQNPPVYGVWPKVVASFTWSSHRQRGFSGFQFEIKENFINYLFTGRILKSRHPTYCYFLSVMVEKNHKHKTESKGIYIFPPHLFYYKVLHTSSVHCIPTPV